MTDVDTPLIAPRKDTTTWYSGVGIAESFDAALQGVLELNWVDAGIGTVATGLEALNLVFNPFQALLAAGLGWLLEHVEMLSDALDWLAGDPDQIRAYAQTWRNVARAQLQLAEELQYSASAQLPSWSGPAGGAYQAHVGRSVTLLEAMAKGAEVMAVIVETSALLVALVREMVRDLIAELVAALIAFGAELLFTGGTATPIVEAQATLLAAKAGATIARLLRRLIDSLSNLVPVVRQVDTGLGTLIVLMRRQEPDVPGSGTGGTTSGGPAYGTFEPPTPDQVH